MRINTTLTLEQLLLSNVHLGDNTEFLNAKLKPYLLGSKNGYNILNISFTVIQLKLVINFIVNIVALRQKVLVIRNLDFFNLKSLFNLPNVFYYDQRWIGGILTNFKVVRRSKKFQTENSSFNTLGAMRFLPSMVFLFNLNISKWALIESSNLEIPISALVNSSSLLTELVNYPIIGNNQSFESIYLYSHIIKNAILKGKQKETLNILRVL